MKQIEEAYRVHEVAQMMGFSMRTIVRIFEGEAGVLVKPGKRQTIRIPRAVYRRVLLKMTVR
jgi:transcriptional regulator GlxA family with amidase domain